MKTVNLGQNGSVFNTFLAEMRDASIQKDRMRFRNNLERVGEVFANELSWRIPRKRSRPRSASPR